MERQRIFFGFVGVSEHTAAVHAHCCLDNAENISLLGSGLPPCLYISSLQTHATTISSSLCFFWKISECNSMHFHFSKSLFCNSFACRFNRFCSGASMACLAATARIASVQNSSEIHLSELKFFTRGTF